MSCRIAGTELQRVCRAKPAFAVKASLENSLFLVCVFISH